MDSPRTDRSAPLADLIRATLAEALRRRLERARELREGGATGDQAQEPRIADADHAAASADPRSSSFTGTSPSVARLIAAAMAGVTGLPSRALTSVGLEMRVAY